jgi:hypothetical protein
VESEEMEGDSGRVKLFEVNWIFFNFKQVKRQFMPPEKLRK